MSCVSQEWPFRNPCCSGYRMLFSSPCFMILLANICSIVTQHPNMKSFDITCNGITKLLKQLNPYKAPGPDNISPRILKELATDISPLLQLIFQKSLDTGVVPRLMLRILVCSFQLTSFDLFCIQARRLQCASHQGPHQCLVKANKQISSYWTLLRLLTKSTIAYSYTNCSIMVS
jgi:hypothetical protein